MAKLNGNEATMLLNVSVEGVDDELLEDSLNPVTNRTITAGINAAKDEAIETAGNNADAKFAENLDTVAADYIVAQGYDETTKMYFRKWKSGIAECWGHLAFKGTITTEYGERYISAAISGDLPTGLFTATPQILATPRYGQHNFELMRGQWSYGTATNTGNYRIITESKVTEEPSENFKISIFAIGKWN